MILRKGLFLLLAAATLCFTSCGDDDCTAPALSENIVGSWTVVTGETVEFQSDGTLVDPDDGIIGAEVNGVVFSDKSYAILGSDSLFVEAADPAGSGSTSFTFPVTENECDDITLELLGVGVGLSRN